MAAVLEFTPYNDHDTILSSPIWDHVPRVGEHVLLRTNGPYVKYRVVDVTHVCDDGLPESVPHVAIYIEPQAE